MSMTTTQDESSLSVDCLDCKFSLMIVHDHEDNYSSRWMPPGDELEPNILRSS